MREKYATLDMKDSKSKKTKRSKKYRKNSSETNLNEIGNEKQTFPRMMSFLFTKENQTADRDMSDDDLSKRKKNNETFYQTMKRPRKNPYSRSYTSYREFTKATLNDSLSNESQQIDTIVTPPDEEKSKPIQNIYDDTFNEYDCSEISIESEIQTIEDNPETTCNSHEELLQPLQPRVASSLSDIRTLSLESLKSENQQYLETPPKRRKYKSKSDYPLDKDESSPELKKTSKTSSPTDMLRSKQKDEVKLRNKHKRHKSDQNGVKLRKHVQKAFPEGKNNEKRLSLQEQTKNSGSKRVHRTTTLYWENKDEDENNVENLMLNVSRGARIQSRFIDTILHSAATNGQLDIVKFYVDKDKYLNEQNGYLNTALHCATYHKHVDIINVLLEYDVDLDLQNVEGDTALHLACSQELSEVVDQFISKGCDVNIQNENGETPLHVAVNRKKLDIIKKLLDHGADMNLKNQQGNTPIHSAIHYFSTKETIKLLLDKMVERLCRSTISSTSNSNESATIAVSSDSSDLTRSVSETVSTGKTTNIGNDSSPKAQSTMQTKSIKNPPNIILSNQNTTSIGDELSMETDQDYDNNNINKIDEIDSGNEEDFYTIEVDETDDDEVFQLVETDLKLVNMNPRQNIKNIVNNKQYDGLTGRNRHLKIIDQDFVDFAEGVKESSEMIFRTASASSEISLNGTQTITDNRVQSVDENPEDIVNSTNSSGDTLLLRAVKYCTTDVVEMILNCSGIDINVINKKGNSVLHCAAILQSSDTMKLLIKKGGKNLLNLQNILGNTPLHCSSERGNYDTVKYLLAQGAKTTIQNHAGNTPIHCAVLTNQLPCLDILMSHHADVSIFNNDGMLPLHCAVEHVDVIKGFLTSRDLEQSVRFDINTKTKEGDSVLHLAMKSYNENTIEILKLLLDHSADINATDKGRDTILHMALRNDQDKIVALILSHRDTKYSIQNNEGETVLHLIAEKNLLDILSEVRATSSDLGVKNKEGLTPLNIALQRCYGDMAMILLNMAWDLDFKL